jgi:hypothetical protein
MIGQQFSTYPLHSQPADAAALGYILIVVLYKDYIQSVVRRKTLNRAAQAGAEAAD